MARDSRMMVSAEHLKDRADPLKLAEVCKRLSYLRFCDVAYIVIRDESTDSITLLPLYSMSDVATSLCYTGNGCRQVIEFPLLP